MGFITLTPASFIHTYTLVCINWMWLLRMTYVAFLWCINATPLWVITKSSNINNMKTASGIVFQGV